MENRKLEKFLYYILDKVEDCYKKEVEMAIKDFLIETAPEVPVQEQLSRKITEKLNANLPLYLKNLDAKEGSITHDLVDAIGEEIAGQIASALKKETATEVPVQQQLNKGELECIFRHLKMFVQINWDKKENVPDACIGCSHSCDEDIHVLNPWTAFYKFADLVEIPNMDEKEHLSKQDSVLTYL